MERTGSLKNSGGGGGIVRKKQLLLSKPADRINWGQKDTI